jgi:nicotinamidase-related amidase
MPRSTLLVIDFLNAMEFSGGGRLFERALPAARATSALRDRERSAATVVVYVNDVFDSGLADFKALIDHQRGRSARGAELVSALEPDASCDHFVAKPHYSAFFRTGLEALLKRSRCERLILTGVAADICVLATAFDASMRGYALAIPANCVAAESEAAELWALGHMRRVFGADVRPSLERKP